MSWLNGKVTVKVKRMVNVELTASDWQLYSPETPEDASPDRAARALNSALMVFLSNEDLSRDQVRDRMYTVMNTLSKTGAYDTEPRDVLEDILDKVYGKENW